MIENSVIVPTYREAGNLELLVRRLFTALNDTGLGSNTEMIVVDDNSPDDSAAIIHRLSEEGFPVSILVRKNERGLSSAVLKGFSIAKGNRLVCMDADLQHPPEKVPDMLRTLERVEFVLGTRYKGGNGIDKNWPLYRRVISGGARALATPLSALSDPMSGMFGIQRQVLSRAEADISPVGFKIALEVFVKGQVKEFEEVGIQFGIRNAGESKLSGKVMLKYLEHLAALYRFQYPVVVFTLIVFILLLVILFMAMFS